MCIHVSHDKEKGFNSKVYFTKKKVVVYVGGGVVQDVEGLPQDWNYKVYDRDAEKEAGKLRKDVFFEENP